MKCDEEPGSAGCLDLMVDRIRYFTGRHMTARDFRDADAYHRSFRHLHNRVLHGWGIACGLDVVIHPQPVCRHDRVVVRCGMAIDCCGREVIVPKDVVPARIPWDHRPKVEGSTEAHDLDYVLLLCLRYDETLTEKVPVLYSANACSTPCMESGRVREGYALEWHWVHKDKLGDYGWQTPRACGSFDEDRDYGREDHHDHHDQGYEPRREEDRDYGSGHERGSDDNQKRRYDDQTKQATPQQEPKPYPPPKKHPDLPPYEGPPCPDDDDDGKGCCFESHCPPMHCIPLAIIEVDRREELDEQSDIKVEGRRSIALAREHLTHVCAINWTHGYVVRARDLRRLMVRFDRPLMVEPRVKGYAGPRGINERTFVAQWGQQHEDLDFVRFRHPPYLLDDRRTAVFEVDERHLYRGHTVQVTLRCDFILDCHGRPVDGDHLRGRLPSGDGVPGGTFDSWFRVVDDDEYDRIEDANHASQSAPVQEW